MQIQLIPANSSHFTLIEELARTIWNKHYVPMIGQEQVDYMLANIYNAQSLQEQTEVKQHRFYLIHANGIPDPIGFISISREKNGDYWIHKFYVLDEYQGKGTGTLVFEAIKQEMQDLTCIRLTVNRGNYKSINFYFKQGFVIEQVADFDIGKGYYMNDFVMVWKKRSTLS
ncbi:MAG: family N-acetyltransferase [Bacteroidetes bacterium]|jgi:RimJ/RimL family protein N-acetyltransferase|nr:family N-acetyltransferase [Bacteroidota bacterium]